MGFLVKLFLVTASLILGFCLACGITAQASYTWWKLEPKDSNTKMHFGLYRVCVESKSNGNETCYRFNKKDISLFLKQYSKTPLSGDAELVSLLETDASRDVWIMSFFHICLCGIAFLISVPTALSGVKGSYSLATLYFEMLFTFTGFVVGVACVIFTVKKKEDIWYPALKILEDDGIITNSIEAEGRGFIFETVSSSVMFAPFLIYSILVIPIHRQLKRKSKLPTM